MSSIHRCLSQKKSANMYQLISDNLANSIEYKCNLSNFEAFDLLRKTMPLIPRNLRYHEIIDLILISDETDPSPYLRALKNFKQLLLNAS